ncbi:hypothetical protein GCM10010149_37530 [Nonomuraea roseoviolacea subsp. roseoviolacea]
MVEAEAEVEVEVKVSRPAGTAAPCRTRRSRGAGRYASGRRSRAFEVVDAGGACAGWLWRVGEPAPDSAASPLIRPFLSSSSERFLWEGSLWEVLASRACSSASAVGVAAGPRAPTKEGPPRATEAGTSESRVVGAIVQGEVGASAR